MTIMTQEQEAIFRKLVQLAGGDRDLVWRAIRRRAGADGMAPLDEVLDEIKVKVSEKRHGAQGASQQVAM